jgi:hypothetical protein
MSPSLILFSIVAPTLDARLPAGPGPVTNPLKGYAPFVGQGGMKDVPTTLAYYGTTWRELEPRKGEFRFAEWEAKTMKSAATRDKRVVLRVFVDYPSQSVGVPQWLIDAGLKMTPYTDHGGGRSPDYSDPRMRQGLLDLIAQMGRRWNNDPQVAYVQVGILGFWGEWHTWPRNELFAPPELQKEVIDAMHAAFPNKHLLARNAVDYPGQQPWLGFHDDMIPQDTLGPDDWQFLPTIRKAGRADNWKIAPTGGEMVPGASEQYLGKDWPMTLRAVREAHLSWIGPACPILTDSNDPVYRQRAAELSQKLGYEFRLTRVRAAGAKSLSIRLEGINQGVAPFYYPWPVRFALLDSTGKIASRSDSPADVRKWLPGPFALNASLPLPTKPGNYRLAVGMIDPWSKKPTVRFANRLAVVDGWTVLSTLKL